MRGEETQIAGGYGSIPSLRLSCSGDAWHPFEMGLPLSRERSSVFASYLTGELFSVLKKHSILGRLMPAEGSNDEATNMAFEMDDWRPPEPAHQAILHTRFRCAYVGADWAFGAGGRWPIICPVC